jgi:hypothetical protein
VDEIGLVVSSSVNEYTETVQGSIVVQSLFKTVDKIRPNGLYTVKKKKTYVRYSHKQKLIN